MTEIASTHDTAVCHALLNSILDMCPGSIAIIQNDHILCANRAFSEASGFLSGAELRGCLLKDVLPEPHDPALSQFTFSRDGALITASTSSFTVDQQTLLVLRLSRGPQPPRGCPQLGPQSGVPATEAWISFAHGFNNLLTRVMLSSDLLLSELDSGSGLHRHVEAIKNAGMDGAEMIKRMTRQSSHRRLTSLRRREKELLIAKHAAEQKLRDELKDIVTALFLSCEMAHRLPSIPSDVELKLRTAHGLLQQLQEEIGLNIKASVA